MNPILEKRIHEMEKVFTMWSREDIEKELACWSNKEIKDGYVVADFDGTGMLEIEAISSIGAFGGDDAKAVEQAIRDGIKVIPIDELPSNFDRNYLGWVDAPKNRKAIKEYCNPIINE